MGIAEVQLRVAHLQSMAVSFAGSSVPAQPASHSGTAVSASRFAAELDAALGATASTSGWTAPVVGTVTSEFGPRWGTQHEGIDLAVAAGTPVRAAADGIVRRASDYGGYGNTVVLDHGNGVSTLYAHNSALDVATGERVRAGQQIARAGSTGDSTGPHLHFEVEVNDAKVDPRPWLRERGVVL